ncbi:type IV toxin-antitoxin system AbiEi family antitoxin domain-containing protein [Qingrenia yutianensis]|uniref:Type IV toxin-antitoxin system AbiEi family antitoxin domain-containing protein n=1 Tax=Qingrenia yutianensis TaxID=2763676 RepID=A0A926FAF4_9FIRM|nr:type IV toxin-antitoxin system AbiEi family antitoxin domain-containing protein [Qingrenia yutianensis]MBC8596316.1 type IV toxin-antitoxin system AbiEi family antitoxin domain-containing protein [Qingrenia yutianensis]
MKSSDRILKAAEFNGGTITTGQVDEMNIHRTTLRIMVDKGLLDHPTRGVYVLPTKLDDEFYNLQIRFKKGVFSNISALYLLGFTDRTPVKYDMTFPASYNTSAIKNEIIAHRVKKELYEKGIIPVKTPSGNEVNAYCIEHTLCDILKARNAIDIQVITDAFKRYAKCSNKNLPLISEFAKMSRVEDKVRKYLEVLV